jgi:hypothetical protein
MGRRLLSAALASLTVVLLAGASVTSAVAAEATYYERADSKPALSAAGATLSWDAADPSGAYVLQRTLPGRPAEYALVKATRARPPEVSGATAGYRVKGILSRYWSPEVSISYPAGIPLESNALLGGLTEASFMPAVESKPSLTATGEVLNWDASDPGGAYLLRRTVPGRELEYTLVRATHARPAAIAGSSVGYRVKGLLQSSWSNEASIAYPQATPETGGTEPVGGGGSEPVGGGGSSEPLGGGSTPAVPSVNAAPTGPSTPAGGWRVVFADGFGAPIGTGAGQDNFVYPNQNPCCNPAEDHHGNNSNELEVFNSSQVHVGPEGLELIDKYWPNRAPAQGSYPVRNYVSGSVSTQRQYAVAGWHPFTWRPGGGQSWAFECNCRLPSNSPMSGVDPGWWSMDPKWTNEIDFFEEWGWGSGCQLSLLSSCLTGVSWIYHTASPLKVEESYKALYSMFDPSTAFHRYTTVFYPNNTWSEFIDGVLQRWVGVNGVAPAPPYFNKVRMHLLLTNALRDKTSTSGPNPYPGFSSGTRTFSIRSIAVYEDGMHARLGVTGGGVAPGTTIR